MSLFPQEPPKARLIAAFMASTKGLIEEAIYNLVREYGHVSSSSCVFPFTHSSYYREEMGDGLVKMFCSFDRLIYPDEIVRVKRRAMDCEKRFLRERTSNRLVNIDPGYLDAMKLLLATTKNASHRIYLGEGIYGDIELVYRSGTFTCLEWTYPDYREAFAVRFFNDVRASYLLEIRALGEE